MSNFLNNHLTKLILLALMIFEMASNNPTHGLLSFIMWVGYGIYQYDNS